LLSQRNECAELKSWCLGMFRECLVFSSMRLGVPFIAPRQLGAVESIPGRQFLPSVAWRIGQSGAPPDTVRCGFLSYSGAADHWRLGAVGAPDTVRCTPDSPVPLLTVGSVTRRARITRPTVDRADSWLTGQPGAHQTVWCTPDSPVHTGQSGEFYSYAADEVPRAAFSPEPAWRTGHCPVHPDRAVFWLYTANFSIIVSPISST
jgi:hypothetical protein